jgi:2-methylcitrate dehydratase
VKKFRTLAEGIVAAKEQDRFIAAVEQLTSLKAGDLAQLSFTVDAARLGAPSHHGIFDWRAK